MSDKTRVIRNLLARMGLTNNRMVNREIIYPVKRYNRMFNKLSNGFNKNDARKITNFFDTYINQGNAALTKTERERISNVFLNVMVMIRDSNKYGHNLVNNFYSSYVSNYKNVIPEMIYKDEVIEYLREVYKLLKPHTPNSEFKPSIHKLIPQSYTLLDIQSDTGALKVLKERTKLIKDIKKLKVGGYKLKNKVGTLYEMVKYITRQTGALPS